MSDVLILNTAVLDIRSPDFAFADKLAGAGGLAKESTPAMPAYSQQQLAAYIESGCASAGGPGNTAPLQARAGIRVAVGVNLGRGECEGLDVQGRFFYDTLTGNGVDMSAVVVHPSLPTGTTFIHDVPHGERGGIVYFPNANNDFDFEEFKPHVRRLSPSLVYYMYSGLSERGDANEGRDLAEFVAWCRQQGCLTIVDSHTLTGNPQQLIAKGESVPEYNLLRPLLPELDIFFTSVDEAQLIRNTLDPQHNTHSADTSQSIVDFLDFVAEHFAGKDQRAQLFGVTVKNGTYIRYVKPGIDSGTTVFCASRFMVGTVVDLVGAGDSFRAGLTAHVARNKEAFSAGDMDVDEAVQIGNLMATLYVTAPIEDRYSHIPPYSMLLEVVRSGQVFDSFDALKNALRLK